MKTKKIFLYLTLALPTLLLQSCLKDQEDVFDKPYSQRMEEFLQAAQDTLVNAPNGWILDYYPELNQSYGGFTYTIQFGKGEAKVRFENNPDDGVVTSLYKMKSDDGPVLSFDTYNVFLHKYATPSQGNYQAQQGDFEFVIDSIGSDVVKVHGKRSLNTLYLHKLTESAVAYLQKVVDMGESFILSEADLTIGGKPYQFVITDLSARQIDIYEDGKYISTTAFNFTDKGIRLYKGIELNGVKVEYITYDDAHLKMSAEGVETTKLWVDPAIVAQLLGNIGAGNAGKTVTKTIPHLDQVEFKCDAPWVHISKNGDKLTVKVDANPDASKARVATITMVNGDNSSSVKVTQMELSAILGKYTLTVRGYDTAAGGFAMLSKEAELAYEGSGDDRMLYLNVVSDGDTYKFPAIYREDERAVLLQSGQLLLTLQFSSGTYYIGNSYSYGNGYGTNASDIFFDMLTFEPDENGNVQTTLNGELLYSPDGQSLQYAGATVTDIYLYAFSAYPFTNSGILGWWDKWSNTKMVKQSSSPAKESDSTVGQVGGPARLMRGITPAYRSYFDPTPYRVTKEIPQFRIK